MEGDKKKYDWNSSWTDHQVKPFLIQSCNPIDVERLLFFVALYGFFQYVTLVIESIKSQYTRNTDNGRVRCKGPRNWCTLLKEFINGDFHDGLLYGSAEMFLFIPWFKLKICISNLKLGYCYSIVFDLKLNWSVLKSVKTTNHTTKMLRSGMRSDPGTEHTRRQTWRPEAAEY